jgi:hypothetical protein
MRSDVREAEHEAAARLPIFQILDVGADGKRVRPKIDGLTLYRLFC